MSRPGGFSLAAQAPAGLSEREQHVLRERLLEKAGREGSLPSELSMLGGPLFRVVRGRPFHVRETRGELLRERGRSHLSPWPALVALPSSTPRGFPRRGRGAVSAAPSAQPPHTADTHRPNRRVRSTERHARAMVGVGLDRHVVTAVRTATMQTCGCCSHDTNVAGSSLP